MEKEFYVDEVEFINNLMNETNNSLDNKTIVINSILIDGVDIYIEEQNGKTSLEKMYSNKMDLFMNIVEKEGDGTTTKSRC